MIDKEREAAKAWFRELWESPAIKKSLDFKVSNGDTKKYDPSKMPSAERVDGVIKVCRGALS